jgi:hypothetical protein
VTAKQVQEILEKILTHRAKAVWDGAAAIGYDFVASRYLDELIAALGVTSDEHGYYFGGPMIVAAAPVAADEVPAPPPPPAREAKTCTSSVWPCGCESSKGHDRHCTLRPR